MSHYFETPTTAEKRHEVFATIWGQDYRFLSAAGVFSATRLDPGTAVLFREAAPPLDRTARFLDLGCGFGPIAVALATECPQARVDAVDVNERALALTRVNALRHEVGDQVHPFFPQTADEGVTYDEIWSNPPIRIGKPALHELLTTWLNRLSPTGKATMVVSKNLGADSLQAWLAQKGYPVARIGSAKGFRVLEVSAHSAQS
ncbi:MAG: methyltransferase [Propionibacteriaceae bacterium]|jgi:16S rRNA G1207 methylase RsmC|nr:methyltransferase [Propionibacteriaceae bacterium]